MVTPSGDACVSKKQKKAQESTPAEIASSTQVAPIRSGHTGLLFSSRSKPAPISPHFQAPRVCLIGPTFRQAFVEFQDNLYNLKGASEDDSIFKASDESEDSDNSNSDDGRDVEEITPSSFGRELVEHEDPKSLPSGPGAPTSTPGNSDFNDVRERTRKLNMVDERPLILLVDTIDHPPLDPITQKRPLEVRSIKPAHKVRYFHNEWVDRLRQGKKVDEAFKVRLCEHVGLATKKSKKGERGAKQNIRCFDKFFQLAFRDGDLWEHQEEIFKLWEEGKVKGQRVKLPTSAQRSRGGSEEALKPIPEGMKITPWRSIQGIREKHILLPILARVKGGALSLDEMSKEFEKQKTFLYMQRIMIEKLNFKELPDEFQEVGMKNMAVNPRVVDASGEPQPGFGLDDEMQFVDLDPYEEPNLVDATGGSGHGDGGGEDNSSPSGGEYEEDKDEEHEEFPINP
ncbi:hypothetical protein L7F22_049838 [Adiantum nelumboides]|nr:hypothetical protein [Adiantum nelumboides]